MADTSNRGFASMDEDKQHEIAKKGGEASASKQDMSELGRKGGEAAHEKGTAHEFNSEEAAEAGQQSH